MSNNLASIPTYIVELYPGYRLELKPRYIFDEKTATYKVHLPIKLETPKGDVDALLMMKESTFKALVQEHGGTALHLFRLVQMHFSNFRPMMRRSKVGIE